MPYSRVALPVNGYTDSLPYRGSVQGYTSQCLNVFPYDSFDNRRRIGTRPGFTLIGNGGAKIQGAIAVENFVNKGSGAALKRRFVYVTGGKIYVTDHDTNPVQCVCVDNDTNNAFDAGYDNTDITDSTKQPRGTGTSVSVLTEAMPDTVGALSDGNTRQIFVDTDDVEMVAFKHVGHQDATSFGVTQASTTLTISGNPVNGEALTFKDFRDTLVTITAGTDFTVESTAAANGLAIKGAILAKTTLLVTPNEDNTVLTLHQMHGGSAGNTTVTGSMTGVAVGNSGVFTGGTDDESHDFVYMTDGKRYVKVDMSASTPVVSQWIGPYKTVSNSFGGSTQFARLTAQFNSRVALSGIDSAPTNWFLSAINNPFDWIPSAGTTLTVDAVAGSTGTKFGETGDNIKALIPVGSSGLLLACENSMVILTNDPVFSDATVRRVSGSIGCLGPRAFANVGEMGVLIASPQGVFGVDPNSFDVEKGARVSKDKLDRLFANTDFEDTNVVMGYDDARAIAFLAITRTDDSTASRLYALDMGTGSWWPWRIESPAMRGVNNIVPFRPVSGTRPTPFMTTNSGHILTIPEQVVKSQDGSVLASTSFASVHQASADTANIRSNIQLGPINGDPSRRVMLKEVRVILGQQDERDSSGNILVPDTTNGPFLEVIQGETAQQAVGTVAGFVATEENAPVLDAKTASAFEGATTIDGGSDAANPTSGTKVVLWGGFANSVTGTYTPATGDTLLNDTTFSGPGQWTFSRDTTGKWQFKHGTDFYLTTSSNLDWFETSNAVDGLPEEVDLNTLLFGSETDNQVRISEANFVDRTISEKRALARGRDSANRFRIRASDIFLSITADGRSFALEDLSVDIEDGGPFRSSS